DWSVVPASEVEGPASGPAESRRAQISAATEAYQRAMAAAMRGDSALPNAMARRLRATAEAAPVGAPPMSSVRARELEAVVAMRSGDRERAVALLREAAAIEDSVAFVGPPTSLVAHELLGTALLDA